MTSDFREFIHRCRRVQLSAYGAMSACSTFDSMTASATRFPVPSPATPSCELILYATPSGPLADQCHRYFRAVEDCGSTTAQLYPPHCTLTGFFRRPAERRREIIAEVDTVLDEVGPVPVGEVEVSELRTEDDWVGLVLRSPWLEATTAEFKARHRLRDGDDPLRLKSWLHLSLAYGATNLAPHRRLANDMIDPAAEAVWSIALWQRHPGGAWSRLTGPAPE